MEFWVQDSDRGPEQLPHKIYAASYEPYWQQIRRSCSFTPMDTCRASLARLEYYMISATEPHEKALRLWRAYNLLNAIPIGQASKHGIMLVPRPESLMIKEYRRTIKEQLATHGYPSLWDWAWTRTACKKMWADEADAAFLTNLRKELMHKRAWKDEKKRELHYFLSILEETQPE